jgi:hypothetical protein
MKRTQHFPRKSELLFAKIFRVSGFAHLPLIHCSPAAHLPLTATLTYCQQEGLGDAPVLDFDLLYAQTQLSVLDLPVVFCHFAHRNIFNHY